MGKCNPPMPTESSVKFGVYACSPTPSSFTATFTDFTLEPSQWLAHPA
ncbi:hypothetical protein JCM19239_1092 [Vibrio variabilis]|uniref:Uncharacterized protein n=2 Tax=Vibrio TaxID=662 RepID=A0ABQ0JE89_9VIBR|nr:hypothetical protein JCM19239_1092 [Vibrio variabilis]